MARPSILGVKSKDGGVYLIKTLLMIKYMLGAQKD